MARKVVRAEGAVAFREAELAAFGLLTGAFSYAAGILVLALLVVDVVALAPGLSAAGVVTAAAAVALLAIGFVSRFLPRRWLEWAFFVAATLALAASALLQIEEQPSEVFAFHLVAMAPVAAAAFARWSLAWHVGWLASMLAGLLAIQALPVIAGSNLDTSGRFFTSFAVGAVVSVAVVTALRLERFRGHVLNRRIAAVSRRASEARAALAVSLAELQRSQLTIRKLEGILPACASCGRVRTDDDSEWLPLADYLVRRGAVSISHGLCPDCYARIVKAELGEG
jgi:hypothetical protein